MVSAVFQVTLVILATLPYQAILASAALRAIQVSADPV